MEHPTILQALYQVERQNTVPMHMPGHKRNQDFAPYLKQLSAGLDITEIHGSDCLHHPEGIILQAMERGGRLWNVPNSYLLINGSTCGILAGIHATTVRGDRVLMARACHKSVYNGIALCGLQADYLLQTQLPEGYYAPVDPTQVELGLQSHPHTKLVIITSPTYEGYLSDVRTIANICHQYGTVLLVDEAHGAHLGFCDYFTGSALQAGADIVVQSLHKTLPSLTQTAIAHIQGNLVNPKTYSNSLGIFETSSPSYLLMASIDGCLHLLEEEGAHRFAQWQKYLEDFYERCHQLQHLKVVEEPSTIKDPSKIVIDTSAVALDGNGLKECLRREWNIELEMAYGDYALAMTGMGDRAENLERLSDALLSIDGGLEENTAQSTQYALTQLPPVALPTHETHNRSIKNYPVEEGVGKICGSYIWAYPPGVPMIAPGEVMTAEILQLLQRLEGTGVEIQDTMGVWPEEIATIPL